MIYDSDVSILDLRILGLEVVMVLRMVTVVDQRLQAILEVVKQGRTVTEVAARCGVSRQTVHRWLRRYETDGLDGLEDRSHHPKACPHQMPVKVEAALVALRQAEDQATAFIRAEPRRDR